MINKKDISDKTEKTDNIRYLTEAELVAMNQIIISIYSLGEIVGVKSPELLDSAINRPRQSAFGNDAYKTIFEKTAALFESLAQNHAFHNANKRVAFSAAVQFLRYNRYKFIMNPKEAETFTIDVVQHKYSLLEISDIIEKYSNFINGEK